MPHKQSVTTTLKDATGKLAHKGKHAGTCIAHGAAQTLNSRGQALDRATATAEKKNKELESIIYQTSG